MKCVQRQQYITHEGIQKDHYVCVLFLDDLKIFLWLWIIVIPL